MKVLLTGSSGWLGRFLAPRLREEGHQVVGVDIAPGEDTQVTGSIADRALATIGGRRHSVHDADALARTTFDGLTATQVVADQRARE